MTDEKALELLNDMQFKDEYQGKDEYTDMLLACKQALGKQIPKKVASIYYPKCPNCCRVIDATSIVNYCTYCRQALDWGDTE